MMLLEKLQLDQSGGGTGNGEGTILIVMRQLAWKEEQGIC